MADDYGNFIENAASLALGSKRNGSIEVGLDQDMFAVVLQAGYSVTFEVSRLVSAASGGLSDPFLTLFDGAGNRLAYDDDGFGGFNARLHFNVPATGTYYLLVDDYAESGTGTYSVGAYRHLIVSSTESHDFTAGGSFPEAFAMGRGIDTFRGGGGDDLLDGGPDRDTITYAGPVSNFSVERVSVEGWSKTATMGFIIHDRVGNEGNDRVINVERVRFADANLALDLDGHAGTTVKIIGAVFGKEAVNIREYVGIGLAQLDGGTSRDALIALALEARFGGTPSANDLVNVLYTNVVGVAPSPADLRFYTDLLDSGVHTPVSLAGLASDIDLNLANIGFDALTNSGVYFS